MIFVIKRGLHEERRSPVIIWLWFSSVCFGEFPKIFSICEIGPANHLKAEKIAVTNAVSLLFYILCFLPLSQIWSYEFLLSTGTREICRKVQQILGDSTGKNAINLAWKILIFFVANITYNGIELRQYLYLCMGKLSNLSLHLLPVSNLCVSFSFDLFFRRNQISHGQEILWSLLK